MEGDPAANQLQRTVENGPSPEKSLVLQNELEENNTYFISWLKELSLDGKDLESIEPYRRYLNNSKGPMEYEDTIKSEYLVWKIQTFRNIIRPLVDAFLYISFGNEVLARKNVSWVEKIVTHCMGKNIFSEDYAKGIKYLCTLINIHTNLKFATLEEKDYWSFSSCSFNDLTDKGKAMVWFAKCRLRFVFDENNLVIRRQIVNLDPNNWLWTWNLFHELKQMRNNIYPSEEEIGVIMRSIDLTESTEFYSMCICDFSYIIAEILNHRVQKNLPNTILTVGSNRFESNEAAIDFIRSNASDAFKNQSTFLEATTIRRYGIIFSNILPPEFHDLDEAKKYKKAYLKIIHENCDGKPENSLFLTARKNMYRYVIYRIQGFLKSWDKNLQTLDEIFTTVWENTHWDEHEDYSLHFLHGCYFSLKEDVQNALFHWLKMDFNRAVESEVPSFLFVDFSYTLRIKLYNNWPEDVNLHFDEVINAIQRRLDEESDLGEPEKVKLSTLKLKLEEAMKLDVHHSSLTTVKNEDSCEDSQFLQNELNNCENYFIQWLNGYDMTKEKLVSVTDYLYDRSEEPNFLTEECLKKEFLAYDKKTLEIIIIFLIEAFLNISFGNVDLGTKNISWVDYAVKYCVSKGIFSEEYGEGFTYISNLLKMHANLKCGLARKCDHGNLSSLFDELPNKGKAMIYFAKFELVGLFSENQNENIPILKELVSLDGENYLWSLLMYHELSRARRDNVSLPTLPSQDEVQSISKATELSVSTKEHSLCVSFLCVTLADIVAHRIKSDLPNEKIYIGNRVFQSHEEAVDFIKGRAREAIQNQNMEMEDPRNQFKNIILRYTVIFHYILPYNTSDVELGNECKMLLLKLKKNRDYEIFLGQEKKNYRLSIDLLQKLLSQPKINSDKIETIFVAIWKPEVTWKEYEASSFHFLNGCYFIMKEDIDNALKHWLQMDFECKIDEKFLFIDFAILHRIRNGYNWSDKFNLGKVNRKIMNPSNILESEKEKLSFLKLKIENAMKVDNLCCQKNEPDSANDSVDEELIKELETCETYFIFWLDDYQMTPKKLLSITESLYQLITQPSQQTKEEVEEDFPEYSMLTLQMVILPLVEAFLNIICGNVDLATKNISWVEYVVKHCLEKDIFSEDYADGIKYLCRLTKIHANLKLGHLNQAEHENFEHDFKKLTDKGKAMVFAAKWMLNEQINDRKNQAALDLKQVVALDSENWVWNYVLCNRLRFLRRQGIHSAPEEDEISAIARAVEYSVSMPYYRPMCIAGLCQCLAEILNDRFHKKLSYSPLPKLEIGTKIFQSEKEIIEYIKTEAKNAFKDEKFDFPEAIRYGEIFSSLLPFNHRDYALAEKCYDSCLKSCPGNGKANHRMGILQLSGKGDVNKAIHFFKRAIEVTPANFPAWIDLIQTLLGSPGENQTEIENSFKTFWGEDFWSESDKFSIHFLEGCYFAMKGEIPKAVSYWKEYNSHTPPSERALHFHQLERISKRHKWRRSAHLNFQKIFDEIMTQMTASDQVEEELEFLKLKIESVMRPNTRNTYTRHNVTNYPNRPQNIRQFRRSSVNDNDEISSWRNSNLPTASNGNTNFVQEPAPPPLESNRYIPPHIRARLNHNNGTLGQTSNRGTCR